MSHCIFHDIEAEQKDRQIFEISEQAYKSRECVLIYVENADRAAAIDRILWILKQEAFIPHKIFQSHESGSGVPIAIVTEETNPVEAKILIADAHCSLDFACGFASIHEFVMRTSPQIQQACRDRFRAYRDREIPVEHLKA